MTAITERFEARIPASQKEVIRQACELMGRTMSDFVISAAITLAEEVLEKERVLKLNAEQSREFVEILLADNEPGERLKQASDRYKNSSLAG